MIKEGDFVEVEYQAYVEGKKVDEGKRVLIVGKGLLMKGLDEFLVGKDVGEYELELPPEKAFGERKKELVTIIPVSEFKKHGIEPKAGMVVNIDNFVATIKSVSGGRTIVDFNHPLAGKTIKLKLKVIRVLGEEEKVKFIAEDIAKKEAKVEGNKVIVDVDENTKKYIEEAIKKIIGKEYVVTRG